MAIKKWEGKAGGVAHAYTVTVANTWAAADTITATINTKAVTVTVATGETTTNEVAAALAAAINAPSKDSEKAGTETRNVGGRQYPEFAELEATAKSNVVTITHRSLGVPYTLTASATTAGSGTATAAVSVTAVGPHHANNASNWSGGALPADGDTLVFDEGAVDCLYGLNYFRDNTLKVSFLRTTDYTGQIGLPATNVNNYPEYRDRFLELYDNADAKTIKFEKGNVSMAGGSTYLDLQGSTYASLLARDLGSNGFLAVHGGTVSDLYLGSGDIVIDPDDANQTSGMTIDALEVESFAGTAVIGRNAQWANAGTTGTMRGGTLFIDCAQDQGTPELALSVLGGEVHQRGDGNIDSVTIQEGLFSWEADGDVTGTINVWSDGTLDLSRDGRTKAFSGTINVYDSATVDKGTHTPTLTPLGCTLEDVNVIP